MSKKKLSEQNPVPMNDQDFRFLALAFIEKSVVGAYRQAYEIAEDDYSNSDRPAAQRLKDRFIKSKEGQLFMKGFMTGLDMNPEVASPNEVLGFLSDAMRGKIPDQFGMDPALSDRIKAAEDIGKRHKLWTDQIEVKADTSVADAIARGRMRALNNEGNSGGMDPPGGSDGR